MTALIQRLLPPAVSAVDAFTDPPDATLFPEEAALVAKAVAKRRLEFTTARVCARSALARLGLPPVPILSGDRGAPRWPQGIVGSLTHCAGYRAAAVARAREVTSIGIDAEPHDVLPEGVREVIAFGDELTLLDDLAASSPGVCWDRLMFSAKESVYKAWFPLTGSWLGFEQAAISIDPDGGEFTARLLVPGPTVNGGPLEGFTGRWLASDGLVITAITVLESVPGP